MLDLSCYGVGSSVVGRRRRLLTAKIGLLLAPAVHPVCLRDHADAEPPVRQARRLFMFVERIISDTSHRITQIAPAVARTGRWQMKTMCPCERPIRHTAQARGRRAQHQTGQAQPSSLPRLRASLPRRCRLRWYKRDPCHAASPRRQAVSMSPTLPPRLLEKRHMFSTRYRPERHQRAVATLVAL